MASYKSIQRSDLKESFVVSGVMYVYALIFAMFGAFFIYVPVEGLIHFLLGVAFMAPVLIVYFFEGMKSGDREFKKLNYKKLNNSERENIRQVSLFKAWIYVIPFLCVAVVLALLAFITDVQIIKLATAVIFLPATKMCQSFNLLPIYNSASEVATDWTLNGGVVLVMVLIYALICALTFWIGYLKKVRDAKDQFSAFITEIVENDRYRN